MPTLSVSSEQPPADGEDEQETTVAHVRDYMESQKTSTGLVAMVVSSGFMGTVWL